MNNDNKAKKIAGKRYTFYFDKNTVTALESFSAKTGMKKSHIVCGLIQLLSDSKLDNKYKTLHEEINRALHREESKRSLNNVEAIIERANQHLPDKFVKRQMSTLGFLPESVSWCSNCNKYCVVVVLDKLTDTSKLIGDLYLFKAQSSLEKLIVIMPYLYNNLDRQIIDMLYLSGIHISCALKLDSELIELYK